MKLCVMYLTCANREEADRIAHVLLEKKLVACVKKLPVQSDFLWQTKRESADEVLLIMDSVEDKFLRIEKEVKNFHSYETFILVAVPVSHTTQAVEEWMKSELHQE